MRTKSHILFYPLTVMLLLTLSCSNFASHSEKGRIVLALNSASRSAVQYSTVTPDDVETIKVTLFLCDTALTDEENEKAQDDAFWDWLGNYPAGATDYPEAPENTLILYPEANTTVSAEVNPGRWFIKIEVWDDNSEKVLEGKTFINVEAEQTAEATVNLQPYSYSSENTGPNPLLADESYNNTDLEQVRFKATYKVSYSSNAPAGYLGILANRDRWGSPDSCDKNHQNDDGYLYIQYIDTSDGDGKQHVKVFEMSSTGTSSQLHGDLSITYFTDYGLALGDYFLFTKEGIDFYIEHKATDKRELDGDSGYAIKTEILKENPTKEQIETLLSEN